MSQQASWSSSVSKKMRHISGVLPVRLALLFIAAVLFTLLAGGNATAGRLFQSPQSPPAQPPPAVEQAQPLPDEPPLVIEQAQPLPDEPPQPVEQPVDQAQPEIQQVEPEQSIAPVPEEPLVPPEQPEETQPFQDEPLAEPEPERSRETARNRDRATQEQESRGSQNFVMDRAEFVDSVIVSGAYLWVCCGFGLLLLVPIFLLVVEIRGRSKLRRRD